MTKIETGIRLNRTGHATGDRYRYLGDDNNDGFNTITYTYDAFGSLVEGDLTGETDYGYLGKQFDSQTGLYNYGYRDYAPVVARFTTVDPIRDGCNWFLYCRNDPLNFIDIAGLLVNDIKHDLVQKEENVKKVLENILENTDDYNIDAYQRKALTDYPGATKNLAKHSLYVITNKNTNDVNTLSFNGTNNGMKNLLNSEGAWALNTETDLKGYNSLIHGQNSYDMKKLCPTEMIDVKGTVTNILNSINSNTTYYAIDHVNNKKYKENCNTALYNTIKIVEPELKINRK